MEKEDIILATLKKRRIALDDWQIDVYNSESKQIVVNKGRQIGGTTVIAAKALKNALRERGHVVLIVSKAHRQSSYLFDMIRDIVNESKIKVTDMTQTKIIFSNTSRVYSLPSGWTGAGIRGMTVHTLIIDEAAYVPDGVEVACDPMLAATQGQKILISTPTGPDGFFFRACQDEEYERYEIPSTKCQRISFTWLERRRKMMSKNEFEREYMCKFIELAEGMMNIEIIKNQTLAIHETWKWKRDAMYFLGVDVARFGKDASVLALCEYHNRIAYIVWVEKITGARRTTDLAGRIVRLCREMPNIKKIIVDESGVGGGAVDMLVEQLGARRILGVNNASRGLATEAEGRRRKIIKEDLYSNLVKMLEKGELFLDDDINILRSLRQVKYEYSKQGNLIIYGADHDVAEAIVRAIFPFVINKPKRLYISGIGEKHFRSDMQVIEGDDAWLKQEY